MTTAIVTPIELLADSQLALDELSKARNTGSFAMWERHIRQKLDLLKELLEQKEN